MNFSSIEVKPKVAVLMAAYNGSEWISAQVASILSQQGIDLKLFVSDDGSYDSTIELIQKLAESDERIVLLPQIDRMGSAGKNFYRLICDVNLEEFDYIALADQDDVWQADKLSHAIQQTLKDNLDAYSSNVTAFWPSGKQKIINKAQPQQQWDFMFESAGPGCTFLLTRKLALDLQNFLIFNQQKCQFIVLHDWFIYAFARSRNFKWTIDNQSHMLYRQHASNVVGANVGFKAKLVRLQKLRKGWFVEQALLIADILGYSDAWPIQKLKHYHFLDRLALIMNIKKLRRHTRDRVALALFLLMPLINKS